MEYTTVFGSLKNFQKGGIELIDDDPKHYAFSNIFEVASMSKPYEKVAVGKNMEYAVEAIRAEGTSGWYTCDHDETVLCMDGSVAVHFVKLQSGQAPAGSLGSHGVAGEPNGPKMGHVELGTGHMALLPKGSAYQFVAAHGVAVLLQQTCVGPLTIERWAEICLS
jgi:hypothetical protein